MTIVRASELKRGMVVRHKDRQVTSFTLGGGNERKNWIGGVVKEREFMSANRVKVTFKEGTQLYENFISFTTDAYEPLWEVADEEGRFS